MKAVVLEGFGGPEVLKIGEVAAPTPGSGQVLIRVAATSVNRADLMQRQGRYPPPPGESDILGLEVAGTVAGLGSGVRGFKAGERVLSLVGGGAYAELATAYAGHVMRVPENLSFAEAACVCEAYITAYMNVFMRARLAPGESALIHGGGGGVGTAAIQLCKALNPTGRVFATASAKKLAPLARLGVDAAIDYKNQDFATVALEATGGRGVDVILDHVGGPNLAANLEALAVDGRLALISTIGGREAPLDLAKLMQKRQTITGSVLRARPVEDKAAITAEFEHVVMPLFAAGRLKPVIHKVYALADVAAAHRAMEANEHFGKIVLAVS